MADPETLKFFYSFFSLIGSFFSFCWEIFKLFWWVLPPIFLFNPLKERYLLFKQTEWIRKQKFVLLELKMPRQELKPIKAMENVFSTLWGTYDPANKKEKWFEGKFLLYFSLEIASIEGVPHFYIRVSKALRKTVESAIYSQFPEIEIAEASDYARNVPANLPNKDWDLWGCDYVLAKSDIYPIKTYRQFFEEKEGIKEEKQIEPLAALLEGLARLEKGEQIWMQIMPRPVSSTENSYVERGKAEINRLVGRPEPPAGRKSLFSEFIDLAVFGLIPGGVKAGEKPVIPPEMKLTPGERGVVQAVEEKISKPAFSTNIRFIYLAKRENFFGAMKTVPIAFFNQFSTQHLNGLRPYGKTATKVQAPDFFVGQRTYLKKRAMFRKFRAREKIGEAAFILNIEELATLFHFPNLESVSEAILPRIETKKSSPPMELPVE
ncbi:MAG: hypothetical protein WC322_03135 [Candidatus Paceibacterota bacterium]|jgi:hypothetical protein